ncbi:MAG: heparinase II/III family protein [Thermoflexaceae bacterium]|nr:heparinase II/III family protein [Thermoflexaceae bacterium]
MFLEVWKKYNQTPHNLEKYPKASCRMAWKEADDVTRHAIIQAGEQFLGFEFPYLTASDFMEFSMTGNRTNYENKLFSKRRALDALVLAECMEHNGRFMKDIINGIYALCDETAWQLPAHNSYIRDTPQLPLPDTTNPVIELFSCETGSILATVHYLLEDELNAVSPFICKRIRAEIKTRILNPYLTKHFWWMGKGKEPMCNWTIWCTQNILLTVFLISWPDSLRERVLKKSCRSIDYFLKDYGDDGCCDEGAQYYRHAGLCLFQALDILCCVTNQHFSSLWNEKKIKNIASYILNVHVDDKYYINFADCSPVAGRAGIREYLFGRACNLPFLIQFAASDYQKNPVPFQPDENNLYYRLQEIFTRKELLKESVPDKIPHPSVFYPSVGIFIARNQFYTLAVKCGDNNDSHNHNDTGSIIVYKNGNPFLIDVGVESYTQKTFSPQRYEIWTMQSDYHNLPTINGYMQKDGAEYKAAVIHHELTGDGGNITTDIAGAYPKEAGIKEYIRNVFLNADGIQLHDYFHVIPKTDSPVILNLITYEKPHCEGTLITIGNVGKLTLSENMSVTIEEIPINDERLKICWKHNIYRIRLIPVSSDIQIHIC